MTHSKALNLLSVPFAFFAVLLTACQGQKSTKPPVMPIQNMVTQTSYAPQSPDDFFSDKRSTREPVANTVAEGEAKNDIKYDYGRIEKSSAKDPVWVQKFPFALSMQTLKLGQKNYDIYCAPCHGLSGHNDGLVTEKSGGSIRPKDIHEKEVKEMPVGRIYNAVTNGVNNWTMPGFSSQLNTTERWAIVTYVRALQLSESGKTDKNSDNTAPKKGETK